MAPSKLGGIAAFALAAIALRCVPVVDEEGRACPCAVGYTCCASTQTCASSPSACAPDASTPPPLPEAAAAEDASPTNDAAQDAGRDLCGATPAPLVHFSFGDCDDRGVYDDSVSGLVGRRQGAGVHCAQSPFGPALRFDGDDAGDAGGSYVRVMDSADAGEHACADGCRAAPEQFRQELSISVVLNVSSAQAFSHILGQWYYKDSYLLLTDHEAAGQRLDFSIQATDDAGVHTVSTFFPTDTWVHWVAVFDGREQRLYKDGALVVFKPLDTSPVSLACTDVPLELGQIGNRGPCGGNIDYAYFKGSMGDVRLFNVALSDAQVASLHCELSSSAP